MLSNLCEKRARYFHLNLRGIGDFTSEDVFIVSKMNFNFNQTKRERQRLIVRRVNGIYFHCKLCSTDSPETWLNLNFSQDKDVF